MTAATATFNKRIPACAHVGRSDERVLLLPSADGWSLETAGGRVLIRGTGHQARRRCLEYARAVGVVTLLS